jgi:hypothetical protein
MDEAQRLMRLRMGALRALEWSGVKGVGAMKWCGSCGGPRRFVNGRCSFKRGHRPAHSSITKKSAGTPRRRLRQARRPAEAMAAGIDAASMARRCQEPLKK